MNAALSSLSAAEKWAFFEESIIEQQVVVVYFDQTGKVEHIQRYDNNDSRDIEPVGDKTPTSGNEMTFIEQMIGNLGRFNRAKSSKTYRY